MVRFKSSFVLAIMLLTGCMQQMPHVRPVSQDLNLAQTLVEQPEHHCLTQPSDGGMEALNRCRRNFLIREMSTQHVLHQNQYFQMFDELALAGRELDAGTISQQEYEQRQEYIVKFHGSRIGVANNQMLAVEQQAISHNMGIQKAFDDFNAAQEKERLRQQAALQAMANSPQRQTFECRYYEGTGNDLLRAECQ